MKAHGYKLIIFSCAPTKFIHNNPICSYFAFSFFLGIERGQKHVQLLFKLDSNPYDVWGFAEFYI